MPSRRYYRIKEQNKEENFKKRQKIIFWLLFFLSFFTIGWSVFFSSFFKITEIKIPENNRLTSDRVKKMVEASLPFDLGENILILSKDRLKAEIAAAFPEITEILVEKKFFNSLSIDFRKRIQIGLWCQEKNCYYFDKEGVIFKEAPASEGSLILKISDNEKREVAIGNKILSDKDLSFIVEFAADIGKSDNIKISEFKISSSSKIDLEALTGGGWTIYLDKSQNPAIQAKNLSIILNEAVKNKISDLEYVDLRFLSYKLKSGGAK